MSVALRLRRQGTTNAPYYKVVATDKRSPRDGKFIEIVGTYNPILKDSSGVNFTLDLDRVEYWIKNGAQPSDTVRSMIKKARQAKAAEPATAPAQPSEAPAQPLEAPASPSEALAQPSDSPAPAEVAS